MARCITALSYYIAKSYSILQPISVYWDDITNVVPSAGCSFVMTPLHLTN